MSLDGSILTGNRIFFKDIYVRKYISGTYQVIEGNTIKLGSAVNVQIRIICMNVPTFFRNEAISHDGELNIYLKLERCDTNTHTVIVTSSALKLHRYIQVDGTKIWHRVYDNFVILRELRFDMEVTLLVDQIDDRALHRSALALLQDDETADVELQGTDGTVRAHGCMLAAASDVLRAAFYGDFKEGTERKLDVPDADVAALKLLKQFAYTGYVEGEPSVMATLYKLSSRFMMPNLARVCSSILVKTMDNELLSSLLQLDLKHVERPLLTEMLSRSDSKMIENLNSNVAEKEQVGEGSSL